MILKVGRLALDSVSWTAVKPGVDCDAFFIRNILSTQTLKIRTDSADPNTEETVASLQEYQFTNEKVKNQKLRKDEILGYAQLSSGSGSVITRAHHSGVAA